MFRFLTQRSLLVNILVVLVLVMLFILIFFGSLDFITRHNKTVTVPSVIGKTFEEARKILEDKDFEVEVQDSIYIDSLPPLSVIKQTPETNAVVKINRTVYLTINRSQPPQVEMPNLVGFTLRNAQMYLENLGLHLGDTTFRPDIAKNAVLEQEFNGKPIAPGTKIFMGSTIDFVLGNGIGDEEMMVPDLVNKRYSTAQSILKGMDVNYTPVIDANVIDTPNAFIYRQNPTKMAPAPEGERRYNKIKPGQNIDIYLSVKPAVLDSSATNSPDE